MSKYLSDDEIFGTGSYLSDEEMFGKKQEKPRKTSLMEDITDIGSAVVEGAKKTVGSARAAISTFGDDRASVVERAREARDLELGSEADALKALKADLQARKKTGDDTIVQGIKNVAGAVAANPSGGVQLIAEQAPNAALSLGAGFAGAKAGAAGGALVGGPVGAAIGGVGGFLAGLFGANTLLETGGKAIEKAGQGTFTPEDRSAALREGATKGAVITGVDAVTLGASKFVLGAAGRAVEQATVRTLQDAGIDAARAAQSIREAQQAAVSASKGASQKATVEAVEKATIEAMAREGLLDPALRASVTSAQKTAFETTNTLARRTGRGASAVGLQSVGEGLGEGLGEFVATGEFSPTEAVLEGVAGLSQSLPELYVANRLNEPGILTQAMSQQRADAPPPAAPGTPAAQRELAATLPELEAAVTAYVQPSDITKARTIDEAVSIAEQVANVPLATPAPAPLTSIPALRQMADRNAELVGQANQAGTGFDQRMALEQAQAALPPAAPRTAEQFVDLKPMEPMEARQRLAVLRDQLAEPLTLQIVSHPSEAGKLAIARAQMPLQAADLELNTAAPAPSPAAAQSRIESAALAGQEQQRRAEDAPRQDMVSRTMAAIEARGGVASPYEAELLRAANMGQPFNSIDPSLGRPASTDEQLTAATGVAVGQEAGLGFGARESTRQQPAAPAFEYTPDLQGRKAEQPSAAPEVSIEQTFVQQMRETNTPAARAFVQDYEAGRISDADVTQALEAQRALPASSQERIESAAAQATPEAAPTGVQVEELRSRGVSPVLAEAVSLYGNRPLTEQDLTVEGATARVERAAAQAPAAQAEGIQVETGLEPRSAFLGRNEAIRTGNNLPRPARVGGVPASSLTDEQLRTTAGNENLPAVTRRSAQIELLARKQEQRGAAPAAVEGDAQARLEAAANEGRLAQPSGGMIITTGAKFSSKRDPVPGATFTVNDGNDAQGQPVKHEVTVVDASRMGNTGRLLKQVARIFGKRLVVFESPTLRADGFVQAGDNQSIYVNTSTEASPLAVFFHELTHLLKRENPEAYAALEAVVKRNLRDGAEDYREGADLEEITSDLVGNRVLMDPDFLGQVFEEIAAQNPEGARGIIVRLAAAINKSIRAFKQAVTQGGFTDTEALVKDLNAIQAAVKQALVTYAQQQREPAARLQMEVAKAEQAAPAAAVAPGATPAAAPAAAPARAPVSEVEREFGLDKLRLSAQRQTETPEFKEFYKDSQVRTATGKPVMLYRGMRGESLPAEGVESFTTEPGLYGTGIYMSSSARRSEGYTKGEKGQMYPVFASVKNPIDADDFVERFGRAKRTPEESQRITDQLIAEGYDGVVERGGPGGFIEVMAFRPEQVKSVFNERPTSDPRITKSAQRDWQKSDAADVKKAEVYEERTGMAPYTSEGQISVPLDGEGTKFSVKRPYGEKEFAKGRANDPLTGLPLNKNGTVTLYFPTSNAVARELARTKKLTGATPDANRIYLTNESSGPKVMNEPGNIDHQMDGANVLLQVDPRLLHLDKEYPDGRKDFFIPVAEGQAYKSKMTKLFTLDAPRTRALSKETKLTDLQQRIGDSLNQYLQLDGAARKARLEQARQVLKDEHNVGTLLGVNGKLEKTNTGGYGLNNYNGKDVMSMGLGLASAQKINEKNLSTCPNSAICEGLCLGETSGQNLLYGGEGQFKSGPRLAQYLKTEALVQHPEDFAIVLHNEIEKFQRAAAKEDYQPTVRLNVTSDFRPQTFEGIIDAFPGVMFYDYTKLPSNSIAPNHHLTYSSTGASQIVNGKVVVNKESNWDKMVDDRLTKGMNVAMAFTSRTAMPKFILDERTGQRFQVWDGDNYDARFLDPKPGQPGNELNQGMIVGLTNKDKTTKPEDAAVKHNGFFLDYDPDRDGDTLVIKTQKALAGGGKKTIPIAAKPANDGEAKITASRQRQTDTPEFKRWFGDSKVVDANGEPMVVYHGSGKDFSEFKYNPNKALGIWSASDPGVASEYAGISARGTDSPLVYPLYLSIQNPASRRDYLRTRKIAEAQSEKTGWADHDARHRKLLQDEGFDGVDLGDGIYIAFRPDQIKSATGNSGAFDPANPSITASRQRVFLLVHGGSDFDEINPRFFGQGEPGGLRPLGKGFYGYLIRGSDDVDTAVQMARAYTKYAPTDETALQVFKLTLEPGEVYFAGRVWDEDLLSDADRARRDDFRAANALPAGPERRAAYDALEKKYPDTGERANRNSRALTTEVLFDGKLIEAATGQPSRLSRVGKFSTGMDDAEIADSIKASFLDSEGNVQLSRQRDTGWRDETGRAQFAPGAVAYRYAADVANAVLDKVGLKPISTELGRAMRKMKVEVERAQNLTVDVAEKLKTLSEEERQMISDVIEGELKAGVTPPKKILDLAASMQTIMSEQSAELVRLGMLSPEAAGRWEGKYLPRFYESKLKGEVQGWARAALELVRKPRTMQGIRGSNLKSRGIFKTIPVDELDQWTAEGWEQRDPGFNPAKDRETQVWRDFTREEREEMGEIRDAMFRFVMGYNATQRDVALGRMYERIAQDVASRTEREGFVQVPDTKVTDTQARRYGALAGMYVPKEVMDHLSAYDGTMQNEIVKMYLSALSKWKEGKTVLNPVSHANNILSNLTMAHFAGVSYWDAGKYAGAVRDLMRNDPMVKEAQDAGLFLGTFSRADLLKDMPDQLKMLAGASEGKIAKAGNTVWNALSFFLNKPLGKAYDAEDQFFRYLIYRDARKRGLESDDAVEYAQRFIFTYDDLPKTARIIRDTALPFFSYTYKVVPALASTALEKPWRFAAPAGILYGVNALFYAMAQAAGEGEDDDWLEAARRYITDPAFRARTKALEESERANLPEWMKGMSATLGTPKAIRLGMDDVTNLPLFLDVSKIFPGGDLLDAVNNSGGVAMLQPLTPSSPLLTTFVAMMANRDMFLGKDVTKGSDTQGELAEKRGEWLWRQFSPALAVGNYHWDRTLNAIASITGEPVLGYTGFGKDGLPVQPGLAALQTVGVKVRPIDLEMSERIEQSDRKRLIRELDAEIRRLNQLEARGAITPDNAEAQRELQREKRIRLREGLTVDGEER